MPSADPTYQQGVEQLQVSPSSKNVSSRMVADNNAGTVATQPAVSKNQRGLENMRGCIVLGTGLSRIDHVSLSMLI